MVWKRFGVGMLRGMQRFCWEEWGKADRLPDEESGRRISTTNAGILGGGCWWSQCEYQGPPLEGAQLWKGGVIASSLSTISHFPLLHNLGSGDVARVLTPHSTVLSLCLWTYSINEKKRIEQSENFHTFYCVSVSTVVYLLCPLLLWMINLNSSSSQPSHPSCL